MDVMIHRAVMKPESKISGFIGCRITMAGIAGQNAMLNFPVPWNAAAEQLYLKSPNGCVPPVLM